MATITLTEMGEVVFEEYGKTITDPSQITYIKRHSDWKSKVYQLSMNMMHEIDSNIESKRNIYKETPKIINTSDIQNKIDNLVCKTYIITQYKNETFQQINSKAILDANRYAEINAKRKPFWKKKKNIKELSAKKLPEFIDFYKDKDADLELKYYEDENIIKQQKDNIFKREYDDQKDKYLQVITNDEKIINSLLSDYIKELSNEYKIKCLSKNYNKNLNNTITLSISLPDKDCIESRKGNMLASGKISVKKRTDKEILTDLYLYYSGLILTIVGNLFNLNTCINNVLLNTSYIETNKTTGHKETKEFSNCSFDRISFEQINFSNIDPEATVKKYLTTGTQSSKPKKKTSNSTPTNQKKKRKYEIEYSNEITNMSIDIIISCFSTLLDKYGLEFFEKQNEQRLVSAIKDILVKNEAEQQLVQSMVATHSISDFKFNQNESEEKLKDILSDNNITDFDRFIFELKKLILG